MYRKNYYWYTRSDWAGQARWIEEISKSWRDTYYDQNNVQPLSLSKQGSIMQSVPRIISAALLFRFYFF
jgi:hypothetical protein